jgi:hypothetical protein
MIPLYSRPRLNEEKYQAETFQGPKKACCVPTNHKNVETESPIPFCLTKKKKSTEMRRKKEERKKCISFNCRQFALVTV